MLSENAPNKHIHTRDAHSSTKLTSSQLMPPGLLAEAPFVTGVWCCCWLSLDIDSGPIARSRNKNFNTCFQASLCRAMSCGFLLNFRRPNSCTSSATRLTATVDLRHCSSFGAHVAPLPEFPPLPPPKYNSNESA